MFTDELSYTIMSCFSDFNLSFMSIDDKLLCGRTHGGVSIMWRKTISHRCGEKHISHCIKVIQYDDTRILGVQITTNKYMFSFSFSFVLMCPFIFFDDFCFYL